MRYKHLRNKELEAGAGAEGEEERGRGMEAGQGTGQGGRANGEREPHGEAWWQGSWVESDTR